MTVTATNRKNQFSTNGVTTEFTFDFAITDVSQVYALTVDDDGTETVFENFTSVKSEVIEGGTLTTNEVLSGVDLLIYRDTALTQQVDYESGGKFPADSHEQALDKLTLQNQDQQEELDRTLKSSISNDDPYTVGKLESGFMLASVGSEIVSTSITEGDLEIAKGNEIAMIARSLNALNTQVIYSTDTTTVLDDVLYIYDASEQITYAKPSDVGIGEAIVSVDDGVLTTDAGAYSLSRIGTGVNAPYVGQLSDVISAKLPVGATVEISDFNNARAEISTVNSGKFVYYDFGDGTYLVNRGYISMAQAGAGKGLDDTFIAEQLNALCTYIKFDAGYTFKLSNFVPLSGSVISAKGSVIQQNTETPYIGTSAAAVIMENDEVTLLKGVWNRASGISAISFQGSVLIYKGSGHKISGSKFIKTWGGITGLLEQNGSDQASDVTLESVVIDGCSHNTYLADINGLTINGYISKNSDRDGLRLFRNCQNVTIDNYIIHDNGDPAATGQSRDGMDLYIGGGSVKIGSGFIYNNQSLGIDIKIAGVPTPTHIIEKVDISGVTTYGNGFEGIKINSDTSVNPYIKEVRVSGITSYGNGGYGILVAGVDTFYLNDSFSYRNDSDGIRLTDVINKCVVTDNATWDNAGTGLLVDDGCTGLYVTRNTNPNNTTQPRNVVVNSNTEGKIFDNTPTNCDNQLLSSTYGLVANEINQSINGTGSEQVNVVLSSEGNQAFSGAKFRAIVAGTYDVRIYKRGATTSTVASVNKEFTANEEYLFTIPTSFSARNLIDGDNLVISSTAISGLVGLLKVYTTN